MPKQINGKINIGLVYHKKTGKTTISGEQMCDILNSQFNKSNYNFAVGWNETNDLCKYVKHEGVSTVNDLNEILVFDDGFSQSLESVKMMNDFISLEEVMNFRGVRSPKLILATGHQGLFDLFKKDKSPEGHELFSYTKTEVVRLQVDENGDFNLELINRILNNNMKNVLSIKNQYHGREQVAQEEIKKIKNSHMNTTATTAEKIKAKIKNSDEQRRLAAAKKRKADPSVIARKKAERIRNQMSDLFKESNESNNPQSTKANSTQTNSVHQSTNLNSNTDSTNLNSIPKSKLTKKPQSNSINDEIPKYNPNQNQDNHNTKETGISINRIFQHTKQDHQPDDYDTDEFEKIRQDFHQSSKEIRQHSNLNFDSKIYNDNGRLLVGGLSGSGISSVVANLAQYYALMDKRTLVINITNDDHLIRYFKEFVPQYKKLGRKNSLSTHFAKSLTEISVPVKPNLEIISDYGLIQKRMTLADKLKNYFRIIRFSNEYDIVIIDAGSNFEQVLLNTSADFLNDTLIVTTQDNLTEIPLDLIHQPFNFSLKLRNLRHPVGIIVNKIQYEVSREQLDEAILNLPLPLDTCRLIGGISSQQQDWYQQRLSGELGVSYNHTQRLVFHNFAQKIILNDVL